MKNSENLEKERLTIHERLPSLTTIKNLKNGNEGIVLDVKCPPGLAIIVKGPFETKFASSNGEEIDPETIIKILRKKILKKDEELFELKYKEIGMLNYSKSTNLFKYHDQLFKFEKEIELKSEDHFKVQVINPDKDIDIVKFNLGADLITSYEGENRNKEKTVNYTDYVEYLRNMGYNKEEITIDETSEIVERNSLTKDAIGTVVNIRCPAGHKITIVGKNNLIQNLDNAHTLSVIFADSNNDEILSDTRIRIIKEKTSEMMTIVTSMFYKDLTTTEYMKDPGIKPAFKSYEKLYRFDNGIEMNGEEHLKIEVINPDRNIDIKNVRLGLDLDFWEED